MELPLVLTSTSANAEDVFKGDLDSVDAIEAFLREEENCQDRAEEFP